MRTQPRRLRVAAAAVAGIALVGGSTAWAVAAADDGTGNGNGAGTERLARVKVIDLDWKREHAHFNDVAPEGTSSGDTVQFSFSLAGDMKGSADYSCVVVQTNFLCDGILRLPKGDIYVSTGPSGDQTEPAAIVGGTHAYSGIRGEFTKTADAEDTAGTYRLKFRK